MKNTIVLVLLSATLIPAQAGEGPAMKLPGSALGIDWGMLYGAPLAKAETFMPQVRALGGGFTKVTLFWSQLEPKQGTYNWEPLDTFLAQLHSPEEGLLTLHSSSRWATRTSAWVFPGSPARNPDDYSRFVQAMVTHAIVTLCAALH